MKDRTFNITYTILIIILVIVWSFNIVKSSRRKKEIEYYRSMYNNSTATNNQIKQNRSEK